MDNSSGNTKRIAKNTIVLYIRMIVVLLITLYTSRFVLKALGVDDFGLYNVVGGVVGLLTFFNGTMAKSTQRFLNVAMVKGDDSLQSIFASSVTIHLIIALVFLLLSETLGLWFLNVKVNIPIGRELAANIVYQASVMSFCISIITIPYSAAVIAYEKMTFLAVVSVVDAVLKLGIAISLLSNHCDRLILYGILLLCITILNFVLYYIFCYKKYPILKFRISYNKENFREIFGFVSWTLIGQIAVVGCNQGNIVLVNMFHSLAANAAMSVGSQISNAINNLTTNFQTAFTPQITKSFAEGNHDYLKSLVYMTSKISFCLLFVVAFPVAFNIDWILKLWLGNVPAFSNTFAILFMINGIVNALSMPFNFVVLSSQKIRIFQIATAIVFLTDLPITYMFFSLGLPPTTVLWVKIGVMTIMLYVRIFFATRVVNTIQIYEYVLKVLLPLLVAAVISILLAYLISRYANTMSLRLAFTGVLEAVCLIQIVLFCFNAKERKTIMNIIRKNHK